LTSQQRGAGSIPRRFFIQTAKKDKFSTIRSIPINPLVK